MELTQREGGGKVRGRGPRRNFALHVCEVSADEVDWCSAVLIYGVDVSSKCDQDLNTLQVVLLREFNGVNNGLNVPITQDLGTLRAHTIYNIQHASISSFPNFQHKTNKCSSQN